MGDCNAPTTFWTFYLRLCEGCSAVEKLSKEGSDVQNWDKTCEKTFEKVETEITLAPTLIDTEWEKNFQGHVDVSQNPVGGMITKLK